MHRGGNSWLWWSFSALASLGACDPDAAATDAGAAPEDVTGTCPTAMALVRGGEFTMGTNATTGVSADGTAAPAHRVRVSTFCLDETPVTAAAYGACIDAGACTPPASTVMRGCAFEGTREIVPGQEDSPVNCVGWDDADRYCRTWSHGGGATLPTEAQWEFAATNGGTTRFPWGNDAPSTQLCWSGSAASIHSGVCPVAAHPANARGLRDVVGNVWVWTQDWFANYPATSAVIVNPDGASSGRARTFRGASFGADTVDLLGATVRGFNSPTYRVPQLGFRCARAPTPLVGNPG